MNATYRQNEDLFSHTVGGIPEGVRLSQPVRASSPINLRPYQRDAVSRTYHAMNHGSGRVCLVAPTAFGKTITASRMIRDALDRGLRVIFTVPYVALVDQSVAAFERNGLGRIGVIQADHPRVDPEAPLQVATVQTLGKRGVPEGVGLIVMDEAHIGDKALSKWLSENRDVRVIGLTATPGRAGMASEFDGTVIGARMDWLIREGHLSNYRVFAPSAPDLSKVKTVAGEFHKGQLGEAVSDAALTADIVATWLQRAAGLPTILFAVDRAHAANLQAQFEAEGVSCGYQDAHTDAVERRHIAREFAAGRIQIVANVGTLIAGVDWDVRCIISARPSQSRMFHVQSIGRGLRTAAGKDHLILLDHAGNVERLGFPCSLDWSELPKAGAPKAKKTGAEPMPKACGKCRFVMPPKTRACPICGHEAPPPTGFIETEDGELIEVDRDGRIVAEKPREATHSEKQAWYDQLRFIAKERNRSDGWVSHTYRKKFGVWPRNMCPGSAPPSGEVRAYVRHLDIAFAKSKEAKA